MEVDNFASTALGQGTELETTVQHPIINYNQQQQCFAKPQTVAMSTSQDVPSNTVAAMGTTSQERFSTTAVRRDAQRSLSSSLPKDLDDDEPPPLIHHSKVRSISVTREPFSQPPRANPAASHTSSHVSQRGFAALQLADHRIPATQPHQSRQMQALNPEAYRASSMSYAPYPTPRTAGPTIKPVMARSHSIGNSAVMARSSSVGSSSAAMRATFQYHPAAYRMPHASHNGSLPSSSKYIATDIRSNRIPPQPTLATHTVSVPRAGRPLKKPNRCPYPGCNGEGNTQARFKRHNTENHCPLAAEARKKAKERIMGKSPPSRVRSVSMCTSSRGRSPGKKRTSKSSSRSVPGSRSQSVFRSQSQTVSPTPELDLGDLDLNVPRAQFLVDFGNDTNMRFDFGLDLPEPEPAPSLRNEMVALDLAGDDIESYLTTPALFSGEEAMALSVPDSPWDNVATFGDLEL
eukprot:TRINITY_DN4996_c0_g1_i1.p1 TRINITY_DN4996_c0_g1~~TRINITY_DN4996_c0_g1_i1.p1  ORF type:complete len:462 (+),score=79.43 TRINITY_DN4996_c0_g1_i1:491-1876(+)